MSLPPDATAAASVEAIEAADELDELTRLWPTLDPCVHTRLLTIAQEDSAKRRLKPPTRH